MKEDECIQTREFKSNKMTIKLCSMPDSRDCGSPECYSRKKDEGSL